MTMGVKTIRRILYGVFAVALIVMAGQEVAAAGLTPEGSVAGGAGLFLLLLAATGKG